MFIWNKMRHKYGVERLVNKKYTKAPLDAIEKTHLSYTTAIQAFGIPQPAPNSFADTVYQN